jgi:hypothetical protein
MTSDVVSSERKGEEVLCNCLQKPQRQGGSDSGPWLSVAN